MESNLNFEKPDISLGNPRINDMTISSLSPMHTYIGNRILVMLLQEKKCSEYQITKALKDFYNKANQGVPKHSKLYHKPPTEAAVLKNLKNQPSSPVFIEVSQRQHQKNKAKKVVTYSLTKIGFRKTVNLLYYNGVEKQKDQDVTELTKVMYKAKMAYPSYFPKLFQVLPVQYSVCFYPFFQEDLSEYFLDLLKIKFNEPTRSEFNVYNSFFHCNLPLTEKELPVIATYTKTKLAETRNKNEKELLDVENTLKFLENIKWTGIEA